MLTGGTLGISYYLSYTNIAHPILPCVWSRSSSPVKVQVLLLRVGIQDCLTNAETTKILLLKLETLDESRLAAQQ